MWPDEYWWSGGGRKWFIYVSLAGLHKCGSACRGFVRFSATFPFYFKANENIEPGARESQYNRSYWPEADLFYLRSTLELIRVISVEAAEQRYNTVDYLIIPKLSAMHAIIHQ